MPTSNRATSSPLLTVSAREGSTLAIVGLNRVRSDVGEVGVGRRRKAVVDAIAAAMIYAH